MLLITRPPARLGFRSSCEKTLCKLRPPWRLIGSKAVVIHRIGTMGRIPAIWKDFFELLQISESRHKVFFSRSNDSGLPCALRVAIKLLAAVA